MLLLLSLSLSGVCWGRNGLPQAAATHLVRADLEALFAPHHAAEHGPSDTPAYVSLDIWEVVVETCVSEECPQRRVTRGSRWSPRQRPSREREREREHNARTLSLSLSLSQRGTRCSNSMKWVLVQWLAPSLATLLSLQRERERERERGPPESSTTTTTRSAQTGRREGRQAGGVARARIRRFFLVTSERRVSSLFPLRCLSRRNYGRNQFAPAFSCGAWNSHWSPPHLDAAAELIVADPVDAASELRNAAALYHRVALVRRGGAPIAHKAASYRGAIAL